MVYSSGNPEEKETNTRFNRYLFYFPLFCQQPNNVHRKKNVMTQEITGGNVNQKVVKLMFVSLETSKEKR